MNISIPIEVLTNNPSYTLNITLIPTTTNSYVHRAITNSLFLPISLHILHIQISYRTQVTLTHTSITSLPQATTSSLLHANSSLFFQTTSRVVSRVTDLLGMLLLTIQKTRKENDLMQVYKVLNRQQV